MIRLRKTLAALLLCGTASLSHAADTAICYNCPPEWADWGAQLAAIAESTGVKVPLDNKNSGQALAQLVAERAAPMADVVYYGVTFGLQAQNAGVVGSYKPKGWDDIPAGLKDPEGHWFAIHSGTLGIMVNVDALGGLPVPQSWADLLKPEYKGMVGYLDPSSAFVGYVSAVAINRAMGGDLDDFTPAIDYFRKLAGNSPIVPKQTAYARVLSGELPILVDYDFNAYRARYKDQANVAFVIPREGSISVPYVMSVVDNAPHRANAEKVLDFVLSDQGQALWANAYLRPVRPVQMPAEVAARFLPESDYARAGVVDYQKMAAVQEAFAARYLKEVR
ncbi:ABC transporter substrate-binding protein [Pseudomonas straminea]|uniref:Putative spermidine/putrescine transport system substrate-binding protein n=1 Tax=Pseudomonas straminea TaxID=47882 RepID=A0A1I1YRU3_PSEOC|nr:ABC transporter substrate-binding protein [Pseudomonas straminea]GLX15964.1 ABC transporter substrate-binding protein [Pseudomonas straminea]SFE22314.1 putative spermidine/putrescine transport system substrate-binding protein [Pseudomonas straminea]